MPTAKTRKKPSKRKTYHHGDLERALVDAGLELLEAEGADALSLRKVARSVGVSQAAPYAHFKDKHALLDAIATEGFGMLLAHMLDWAAKAKEDPATLTAYGIAYVSFAVDHPALFKLMFGPELAPGDDENADAANSDAFGLILDISKRLLGDAGNDEQQVHLHAMYSWATVHGLANLLVDGRLNQQLTALGGDASTLTEKVLVSTPPIVAPLR